MLYLVFVFVRQKKNPSGKISVQVIDKASGKYRVIHTVGCSADTNEIDRMITEGKHWIKRKTGAVELDFSNRQAVIQEPGKAYFIYSTEVVNGRGV